ncbi:hypothetical protein CHU92_08465 [Flavobacterium cyanobacteriorum]|uniref:POTRA domain-containing protein n=1 Tax=Flavobacterium cyanobacteriorum TaxID=2022802 RepID=A0A255Z7A7_9FLAO|nr:hypothetical protein [Flavobacterium cyanobacteriorum]OYQ37319.1 hypothetical protein CHU92_08465 [Flavobacterium cyanobacteriorum]
MFTKIKLLLLLLLLASAPVDAQVAPAQQKDTVKVKRDQMYKKLEHYSKRKKFTRFLHKLIFRPVTDEEPSAARKKTKRRTPEMQNTFAKYQGKTVRRIHVETLDPFGYSVSDTARMPDTWVEHFGNRIHLKTKQLTIKNLLLFKRNKPFDSLLVKESERLIRSQRYVRRVVIQPRPTKSKDSVDVYIRVLDSWSLIPNGSASATGTSIRITERNFFGLGHEWRNNFDKQFNTGKTEYLTTYRVPNIMNTYINATVNYQLWEFNNSLKNFGLDREFFSPLTRWAGGVYLEERFLKDSLPDAQGNFELQNFKSKSQDYWAGYSFKIYKGDTEEERTTRLVTTARFFNRQYTESPSVQYDSINFYSDEKLYIASVGLTSRGFVQDKFLFNYDIVEDIPVGKIYALTAGTQQKNNENRIYLGGRYAFGNYYNWGYFSANAELGSFFYKNRTDQTVLRFEALYFTNILNCGKWRFRQFIKPVLVFGDNRLPIITDQLNLSGDTGIQGFDSPTLLGTKKATLTLQTQSYSPWNFFGFRLNPFANFTFGVLGDEQTKLYESKIYSKIGLGLLIYNDYLVFNSFQLSIAFYPSIPNVGENLFRTNTFQNTDITLPDFQVGKPVVVPYR